MSFVRGGGRLPCAVAATVMVMVLALFGPYSRCTASCVHCPEYESSSAQEKEQIIMEKIVTTAYDDDGLPQKNLCDPVNRLTEAIDGNVDMSNFFDRFSDSRPPNMLRVNHFDGIVAAVRFEAHPDSPFTGIFRGAEHGIMRWSTTGIPPVGDRLLTEFLLGTFNGSMGIKLFRDAMVSANLVVNDSFKGLNAFVVARGRRFWEIPDFNIFRRPLDSMPGLDLPQFINIPFVLDVVLGINNRVKETFGKTEKFTGVLSQVEAAAFTSDGMQEDVPLVPVILHFAPNQELAKGLGLGPSKDFREWATLEEYVPTGTRLYTAWTTVDIVSGEPSLCFDQNGTPQADEDGVRLYCQDQKRVNLGDVITKSNFYASQWGDEGLFFRHDRFCPKDQLICEIDDISNRPELGFPEPSYSTANARLCVADDRVDGTVHVSSPSCPFRSSPVASSTPTTCFPGDGERIVELQEWQCPMADRAHQDLLGEVANLDPDSSFDGGCNTLVRFALLNAAEPILDLVATAMRLLSSMYSSLFGS